MFENKISIETLNQNDLKDKKEDKVSSLYRREKYIPYRSTLSFIYAVNVCSEIKEVQT